MDKEISLRIQKIEEICKREYGEIVKGIAKQTKHTLDSNRKFLNKEFLSLNTSEECRKIFELISISSSTCAAFISEIRIVTSELEKLEDIAKACIFESFDKSELRNEEARKSKLTTFFSSLSRCLKTVRSSYESLKEMQSFLEFKYEITSRAFSILEFDQKFL